jgi:hypothetical protein
MRKNSIERKGQHYIIKLIKKIEFSMFPNHNFSKNGNLQIYKSSN